MSSWIQRINIVKMSTILEVVQRFNKIPIKNSIQCIFHRNKKAILKFVGNHKGLQMA